MGVRSRLIAAVVVCVALGGCDGEDDVEQRDRSGRAGDLLVMRAGEIDQQDGSTTSDGIYTVHAKTERVEQVPTRQFNGGDAMSPLAVAGNRIAYSCGGGVCVHRLGEGGPDQAIGGALCLVEGDRPNSLWLATLDRPGDRQRFIRSVQKVSFGGRTLTPPSSTANGNWNCPLAAYERGVVFGDGRTLTAWNARGSRIDARIPDRLPAATRGNVIASYAGPLGRESHLRLADVATGERRLIGPPHGWRFAAGYEGEFSPDGSVLAVPLRGPRGTNDPRQGLGLVDIPTGRTEVAYMLAVRSPTFSPDGDVLYALTDRSLHHNFGPRTRITAYDLEREAPFEIKTPGLRPLYLEATER